jgi:putative hydrolase of the HAD superfamily
LTLTAGVRALLTELKSSGHVLGLLTDGRSRTQRNKIRALGVEKWIDEIVISEEFGSAKPNERN